MKRTGLLFAMALALAPALALAQSARLKLPDLSDLAGKATQSVDIGLEGDNLKTAGAFLSGATGGADADFAEVLKGLQGIYVKVFSFEKPGQYSMRDIEPVVTQVQAQGWKKMLAVRDKEERVEIWLRENSPDGGMFLLVNKPMELVLVSIAGKVDLQTLGKLQGKLGVPAMPGVGSMGPALPAAPAPAHAARIGAAEGSARLPGSGPRP
jgi:hypothetical protein